MIICQKCKGYIPEFGGHTCSTPTDRKASPRPAFLPEPPHQHSYTIPVEWHYAWAETPIGTWMVNDKRATRLACACGEAVKEVKYE